MKRELRGLCLLVFFVSNGITVIMEPKEESTLNNEDSTSFMESFGSCLSTKQYNTFECANRGALSALQSLNHEDDLNFGQVHLERADGYGRELLDWDYDPKDFGNIVKAAARLMERRSLKWNLDNLYPGLQLRAGPMLNGNGILEFVVNERIAGYDRHAGPGRQLTRQLLLPFLLGFKFNLAALIPLLFGFLLIITKKALLLTKIALFVSGLLGWNTLFSSASSPHPGNGFQGFHSYGQEVPNPALYYDHHHHQFPPRPYRGFQVSDFTPYDQHIIREVVDVYDNKEHVGKDKRSEKNFAWTKNN